MSCQSCNSWSTLPAKQVVFGFAAQIRVQKKDMPGETGETNRQSTCGTACAMQSQRTWMALEVGPGRSGERGWGNHPCQTAVHSIVYQGPLV